MHEAEDMIPDFSTPEMEPSDIDPFAEAGFSLATSFELPPELAEISQDEKFASVEAFVAPPSELALLTNAEIFTQLSIEKVFVEDEPLCVHDDLDVFSEDPPQLQVQETDEIASEASSIVKLEETSADSWDREVSRLEDSQRRESSEFAKEGLLQVLTETQDVEVSALQMSEAPSSELVPKGLLESLIADIDSQISIGSRSQRIERRRESLSPISAEAVGKSKYLSFLVGESRYAVLVDSIAEISLAPSVTPLPKTPTWLRGVANLRGNVIFVVDLRAFLGFPSQDPNPFFTRMLVVRNARQERTVGVIVDQINGFVRIRESDIEKIAAPSDDLVSPHLRGVYEQGGYLLSLLDLNQLLLSPAMRPFEAA